MLEARLQRSLTVNYSYTNYGELSWDEKPLVTAQIHHCLCSGFRALSLSHDFISSRTDDRVLLLRRVSRQLAIQQIELRQDRVKEGSLTHNSVALKSSVGNRPAFHLAFIPSHRQHSILQPTSNSQWMNLHSRGA